MEPGDIVSENRHQDMDAGATADGHGENLAQVRRAALHADQQCAQLRRREEELAVEEARDLQHNVALELRRGNVALGAVQHRKACKLHEGK